jgi:hypothetical protein
VRGWETLPAFTPKARRPAQPAAATEPDSAPVIAGAESWKMTLKTPMGPQEMVMQVVRNGATFTGRIDSPMGSETITNGTIAGDQLTWTMAVKKPVAIKVSFEVKLQGDSMTGSAKLGMFGKAAVTGERV